MSPLDLGFMTQLNTKAGAEVSVELTQNKGLRRLMTVISKGVEFWILPEGLSLVWPDIDPSDEVLESAARKTNVEATTAAVAGGLMERPEARAELRRLGAFELDTKLDELPEEEIEEVEVVDGEDANRETESTQEEEEEGAEEGNDGDGQEVAKSHTPNLINALCPLDGCKGTEAFSYDGHGSWLVCVTCGKAWNPVGYASEE